MSIWCSRSFVLIVLCFLGEKRRWAHHPPPPPPRTNTKNVKKFVPSPFFPVRCKFFIPVCKEIRFASCLLPNQFLFFISCVCKFHLFFPSRFVVRMCLTCTHILNRYASPTAKCTHVPQITSKIASDARIYTVGQFTFYQMRFDSLFAFGVFYFSFRSVLTFFVPSLQPVCNFLFISSRNWITVIVFPSVIILSHPLCFATIFHPAHFLAPTSPSLPHTHTHTTRTQSLPLFLSIERTSKISAATGIACIKLVDVIESEENEKKQ